jgi:hypothetical protein
MFSSSTAENYSFASSTPVLVVSNENSQEVFMFGNGQQTSQTEAQSQV